MGSGEFDFYGLEDLGLGDIDVSGIDFDIADFEITPNALMHSTRYSQPKLSRNAICKAYYKYAAEAAEHIDLSKPNYIITAGNFIFGDLIEAMIARELFYPKRIYISTLSLSKDNVNSMRRIMDMRPELQSLDLLTSGYFYSHERNGLIKYMLDVLDKEEGSDRFQLTISALHCKVTLIETMNGTKIVMHGSANLRSSQNLEQVMIEVSPDLYDFNLAMFQKIIDCYKIINKDLRTDYLWNLVSKE
jgi:hypothetical protein